MEYKNAPMTGLPGIMSARVPEQKFGLRVVFPTDNSTRRDIQPEINANKDYVYSQLLASEEAKKA